MVEFECSKSPVSLTFGVLCGAPFSLDAEKEKRGNLRLKNCPSAMVVQLECPARGPTPHKIGYFMSWVVSPILHL